VYLGLLSSDVPTCMLLLALLIAGSNFFLTKILRCEKLCLSYRSAEQVFDALVVRVGVHGAINPKSTNEQSGIVLVTGLDDHNKVVEGWSVPSFAENAYGQRFLLM
jgi:hypothetical protein